MVKIEYYVCDKCKQDIPKGEKKSVYLDHFCGYYQNEHEEIQLDLCKGCYEALKKILGVEEGKD